MTHLNTKHIILIGFQHTGKSTIGCALAQQMGRNFFDLDHLLMAAYQQQYQQKLSCRQIARKHGETFFRDLEQHTLAQALERPPAVIATGGGAVLRPANQQLLTKHYLIHITANPDIVFARIISKGIPTTFSAQGTPREAFDRLWTERQHIYEQLADFSLDNSEHLSLPIHKILMHLHEISS